VVPVTTVREESGLVVIDQIPAKPKMNYMVITQQASLDTATQWEDTMGVRLNMSESHLLK